MFVEEPGTGGRVRVKICGITNAADAIAAIECGADALGFNFFPGSKRYVDIRAAASWISELVNGVTKVAVLVNPTRTQAIDAAGLPFIDALQLHGSETPGFCQDLAEQGIRFIKAIPVSGADSLAEVPNFFTNTIMLDSRIEGVFGGTGRIFSWTIGRNFVQRHSDLRVILAGGLTPENVAEAIATVRPFAVDVSSGVEASAGHKDRTRLEAFFAAVRGS